MMKYLKDHILEELNGAVDYMQKALETKGTMCGETFRIMSKTELDHAGKLLKMFRVEEKPASMSDADYAAMTKEILNAYAMHMEKYEALSKLYWAT